MIKPGHSAALAGISRIQTRVRYGMERHVSGTVRKDIKGALRTREMNRVSECIRAKVRRIAG